MSIFMRRLFIPAVIAAGLALAAPMDFQREIRPILSDNCFQCHGPDSGARMAGLRLDLKDAALAARPRGAALVPGNAAASLLYQRISDPNPARRMPPEISHKSLTPQQIDLVKSWIDQGAPWKEHWAFQAPVKPTPPAVRNAAWLQQASRNPIDRFVLARLEERGLSPAPAADRRTLIRRAALDVTGLPPTPAEIDAYLADTAPESYEHMLDRYLASPHYGEHRARYWLDAARYGDTHGIHIDNYREIWPYRDWVINAFNRNLSFEQFTIEQLAGDLLPNPTLDQRIATGFQRCNVTTNEAGIIEDEYAEIYAKDRADTVSAVWLGMTVGCATCHNHKFDPITQKDFYALGAFFRNTTQKVMDGNISDTPPVLLVPRAGDRVRWEQIQSRLPAIRRELDALRASAPAPSASAVAPISPAYVYADAPKLDAERPLTVSASFLLPEKDQSYTIAAHQNARDKNRGWILDIADRRAGFRIIGDNGGGIGLRASDTLAAGVWHHVAATYDGSRSQTGMSLYVDGRAVAIQGLGNRAAKLSGPIEVDGAVVLGKSMPADSVRDLRLLSREITEAEARLLSEWPGPAGQLTYALLNSNEEFRKLAAEQHKLNLEARDIARKGAVTLVMEERSGATPFAHTLYRGAYDQKRDRVEAATPSVLPPMTADLPRNRLGLAKWLFTAEHPLTARVAVNRMWQEIFGIGLVRTADDFGSQGESPSHAQLLDWLAVDFQEHGWDVKRFYRQILASATYRQLAQATPEKIAKDPENRLLSRGPRFRMDAEMMRDYALAAGGLLAPQIGGPSARPYQPEGVWESVAMLGSDTRFYKRDDGNGLYRRSLYTFWKRSAPPAAMEIFNAPSRESCVVRRERTNTPLQALVTMNDVQFVEAARVLAGSAMQSVLPFDARIDFIALRILARPLSAAERQIARKSFDDFQRYYSTHPAEARQFLDDGERKADPGLPPAEFAAYAMLTSQLLNLDEAVNQ